MRDEYLVIKKCPHCNEKIAIVSRDIRPIVVKEEESAKEKCDKCGRTVYIKERMENWERCSRCQNLYCDWCTDHPEDGICKKCKEAEEESRKTDDAVGPLFKWYKLRKLMYDNGAKMATGDAPIALAQHLDKLCRDIISEALLNSSEIDEDIIQKAIEKRSK